MGSFRIEYYESNNMKNKKTIKRNEALKEMNKTLKHIMLISLMGNFT